MSGTWCADLSQTLMDGSMAVTAVYTEPVSFALTSPFVQSGQYRPWRRIPCPPLATRVEASQQRVCLAGPGQHSAPVTFLPMRLGAGVAAGGTCLDLVSFRCPSAWSPWVCGDSTLRSVPPLTVGDLVSELNPALHLVLSRPAPCFYLVTVPSSLPLVKE